MRLTAGTVFFNHFNLCGLLAALHVSLFSPHQFVQYFQQLCVTANSQWNYCTLFALACKKKKSCRQTAPHCGARDSAKTACQAAAAPQLHQRLMLPPCVVDFVRQCVTWSSWAHKNTATKMWYFSPVILNLAKVPKHLLTSYQPQYRLSLNYP